MIEGSAAADNDRRWLAATLGVGQQCPVFDDPTLEGLRRRFSGLGVYASGSLYEGVIASIIGQSISVSAAAIVEQRFAAQFNPPIDIANRPHWPLPRADQLAVTEPAIVRQSGVTWRRAEALIKTGEIPAMTSDPDAIDNVRRSLLAIPAIGPWTVESAFLWGVGWSDAYPLNDVALLRAARQAYRQPTMTMGDLNRQSEHWRPNRGWASRLLLTALLGTA
jgi:3-methyladenine DNA glycosylase/8-oxoguanine DNA glycosylase